MPELQKRDSALLGSSWTPVRPKQWPLGPRSTGGPGGPSQRCPPPFFPPIPLLAFLPFHLHRPHSEGEHDLSIISNPRPQIQPQSCTTPPNGLEVPIPYARRYCVQAVNLTSILNIYGCSRAQSTKRPASSRYRPCHSLVPGLAPRPAFEAKVKPSSFCPASLSQTQPRNKRCRSSYIAISRYLRLIVPLHTVAFVRTASLALSSSPELCPAAWIPEQRRHLSSTPCAPVAIPDSYTPGSAGYQSRWAEGRSRSKP